MNAKIETMIDEVHDMLIDYMNEDSASPILKKIQELADFAECDGYELGCKETKDMHVSMNDGNY